MIRSLLLALTLTISLSAPAAPAADWPMWRCDPARRGATSEALADELHLQWTLPLTPVTPAWPNEPRLWFDASYEPVVAGETLVVGSPIDGSVRACDVATGHERWRFYTEGPVRFAPVLTADRVFAGSDDGYLYCLRLADGTLLWKVRGAPEDAPDRRHLGNNRLISHWPVRGGPVLADGSLYFAAGLWPTHGRVRRGRGCRNRRGSLAKRQAGGTRKRPPGSQRVGDQRPVAAGLPAGARRPVAGAQRPLDARRA